jgi:cation diffusion facilitator CzcD-associated flavoprotein CzcO
MWYVVKYGHSCFDLIILWDLVLIVDPADIPSHTYQASFEPNKEWSAFYAPAPEIHQYWKHVVHKYGCRRYMKLKQRVLGASWDENDAKWRLEVSEDLPLKLNKV